MIRKLVNEKYFPGKEKFGLIFKKVFSFYFERETLLKNIILFVNYIKFSPHTFDCYTYIYIYIYIYML